MFPWWTTVNVQDRRTTKKKKPMKKPFDQVPLLYLNHIHHDSVIMKTTMIIDQWPLTGASYGWEERRRPSWLTRWQHLVKYFPRPRKSLAMKLSSWWQWSWPLWEWQVLKEQARLSRESARERKAREPFSWQMCCAETCIIGGTSSLNIDRDSHLLILQTGVTLW